MARAIDIVRKVASRARPNYLAAFENGDALLQKHGITTPQRLAHFLAQCLHETGGLTIEWESGAYSASRLLEIFGVGRHSAGVTASEAQQLAHNGPAIFERVYGLGNAKKARELGNLQPGDGFKYRGGGIMQTTGRANYRRMGQKCGVDFEGTPALVVSPDHALKPALAEWTEGNLNEKADANDLRGITRRINGGYNGLADRQAWYNRIRPMITSVEFKIGAVTVSPPKAATPVTPPAPQEPAKKIDIVKTGTTGAVIAAGTAGTAVAAAYGVDWFVVAAIIVGTALLAGVVFSILRNRNK